MKKRNITFAVIIISILTIALTGISYGYWTDRMKIAGELTFEFLTPVVNDVDMLLKKPDTVTFETVDKAGLEDDSENIDETIDETIDTDENLDNKNIEGVEDKGNSAAERSIHTVTNAKDLENTIEAEESEENNE